ncbi:MAG: IS110 family transposase, partial [Erythrobacteraceae bacterium]
MDYFAGLDVSLEKTHICVLDRDGRVVHEATAPSSPDAIA